MEKGLTQCLKKIYTLSAAYRIGEHDTRDFKRNFICINIHMLYIYIYIYVIYYTLYLGQWSILIGHRLGWSGGRITDALREFSPGGVGSKHFK